MGVGFRRFLSTFSDLNLLEDFPERNRIPQLACTHVCVGRWGGGVGWGACRNKFYVEYYCVYVPKHGASLNIMHGLGEAILNNKNNTNNKQDKLVSAVLFERNVKKDFVT